MSDERDESRPSGVDPSIPDGGLAEAMPDWLRRPPAWRGMGLPDVPEAEVVADAVTAVEGDPVSVVDDATDAIAETKTPRSIPAPDASPIDPSSLIELSDLPEWLIGLGKRERVGGTPNEAVESPVIASPIESAAAAPPLASPQADVPLAAPMQATSPAAQDAPAPRFSAGTLAMIGFLVLIIIAVVLRTIL